MNMNNIFEIVLQIAVLLFAVSVHESAHGWMAERFGDPTARNQGRITLNPISHIDPVGSVLLPLILALTGGPVFGWAKPVMVNPYNLRDRRRANMWISAAGPLSNLIMGAGAIIIFLIFKRFGLVMGPNQIQLLSLILTYLIFINVILAIFNLMPIPPLDGGWILEGMLHGEALQTFQKIKPYGFVIFIVIIYLGIFEYIARPIFSIVTTILIRG